MPSLETHLSTLNFSTQLDLLKNLIDNAQANTTLWGNRVVEVDGFTGSIYLRDIAQKILIASRQRCTVDNLTPEERIAGIEVVRKVRNFYQVTDAQIQSSNFFTRILHVITEFLNLITDAGFPYSIRSRIEDAKRNFLAYSEVKFCQQFGAKSDQEDLHPASSGVFGPPMRIVAREDRIRELLLPADQRRV